MQLIVKDEQVFGRSGRCVSRRFEHFGQANVEEPPEHLVHGEQSCRRPTRAPQKVSSADAELFAGLVGKLFNSRLDAFLFFGLRHRHVLTIRNHARGDGRTQRFGDVGSIAFGDLLRVQQSVVFFPHAARFVPLFSSHIFVLRV